MRNDQNTLVIENALIPYMTLFNVMVENILVSFMTLPFSMFYLDIKIHPRYINVVKKQSVLLT